MAIVFRMPSPVRVVSSRRPGRLVPRREHGLRASSVRLVPGGRMDWHSTQEREELLLALDGQLQLEVRASAARTRRLRLVSGDTVHLAPRTWHRVINSSRADARYIYITARGEAARGRSR